MPDGQLALAIGKEGLNARLAARLTGWRVDIQSDTEFAQAEAEAAYGGGDDEEFTGRCAAVLANGKRCPNAALPGSKYCGVPAHQELARREPAPEAAQQPEVPVTASATDDEEPAEDETEEAAEFETPEPQEQAAGLQADDERQA